MKALIIGATGATGKDLVDVLLEHDAYSQVIIFVRKATGRSHARLVEVITDFAKLDDVDPYIHGDVLFSCLGTTLKAAGSKEIQWAIDYEIPFSFASRAKKNGVRSMVLLSAYGASTSSRIFYSKLKGKLEEAIKNIHFQQLIIFKPGLLLRKHTDRPGEKISAGVLKFLNTIGLFRKFRPLPTTVLASKLAKAPFTCEKGLHIISLDEITAF